MMHKEFPLPPPPPPHTHTQRGSQYKEVDSTSMDNILTPHQSIHHLTHVLVCQYRYCTSGYFKRGSFEVIMDDTVIKKLLLYFPDYRSHSIISCTPNSDRQPLRFKNYSLLDQETPACDSSYILCMHMHV